MQVEAAERVAPIQSLLPFFEPHELCAWEQEESRRQVRRDRRPRIARLVSMDDPTRSLFDDIDVTLLDAPLLDTGGENELDCTVDPLSAEDLPAFHTHEAGVREEWTDAAIYQLHEATLHYSLKALHARGNGVEKRKVLQWIFAPTTMVVSRTSGTSTVEVPLPQELTPFSFELCCRICGYRSEHLMDGLRPILKEMGLGPL